MTQCITREDRNCLVEQTQILDTVIISLTQLEVKKWLILPVGVLKVVKNAIESIATGKWD